MKNLIYILFHAIFWVWNVIFLVVVYLGIVPIVGLPLARATQSGTIPWDFTAALVGLAAIPLICTLIGLWRFRKQPVHLIRLFYGVEAPLFLLCLLRLFLLRELTPASTHILVSVGICVVAYTVDLLVGLAIDRPKLAWLQLTSHTLMLLVGCYTGIVLLFYAVPVSVWIGQQFFSFAWVKPLQTTVTSEYFLTSFWGIALSLILFGLSCSLFVAMPSAMTALYVQTGQHTIRTYQARYGRQPTIAGILVVIVASGVLFFGFHQQPQVQAFAMLSRPAQTERDRQERLADSESIRQGLLNAYLANYRYLSSEPENNHIQAIYQHVFQLPDATARSLQGIYNQLMSPFLYHGPATDGTKAEALYEQFFDTPIQKGDRIAINRALQSTYNQDEAKAGLLNFNQQKVWLKSQQVTVQAQGDWATIELHEAYENQTPQQQEVFYSFSLPESAVLTGLWLGDSGDRAGRFPFVVSPRGAAQQVYNQQVQVRIDPALVEQVGPRHYRLRAFPVPPKQGLDEVLFGNQQTAAPAEMHLWLTYKVMQQPKGWAMPHLGERRNLYWTAATQRSRNGKAIPALDAWVEPFLPASQPFRPKPHQAVFANGDLVTAKPLQEKDYVLPQAQRFAVVLDTSRSMKQQVPELTNTFKWLVDRGFTNADFTDNDADLYLTAAPGATPQRLDGFAQFNPAQFTFYGSISLQEMLQQFRQLRQNTYYNAVLLLTDRDTYDLATDLKPANGAASGTVIAPVKETVAEPASLPALWLVHLGDLPPAYDDATLKTIDQSGGGVGTAVPQVLYRLATKAAMGPPVISVVDGYVWQRQKLPDDQALPPATPQDEFAPIAARQLILGLSQRRSLDQVTQLDTMHAIAQLFKIVTPYSSMIVLVNDAQRDALRRAESQTDRFDREVESGKEQLTKPVNPLNVATPEPASILGLGVAAIGLFAYRRHRRPSKRQGNGDR